MACWCAALPAQIDTATADVLAGSTQAIVVTTASWSAVQGRLQQYARADTHSMWHAVGRPVEIVVGTNGLGWGIGIARADSAEARTAGDPVKKEGDGKSPAGVFTLGTAFGYAAQPLPGLKMLYLTLAPSTECVDDPQSKSYNRIVDRNTVKPDWKSSEHMRAAGESYVWGAVVNHNGTVPDGDAAPLPGGGSCVFLHIWHRQDQGTAGCTAMTQADLERLLVWLDPMQKPLLVQLPEPALQRLAHRWSLTEFISNPH
jgi:L,D-peptidoglycan transpeptidase YkuD (ErfK/YbiS/YcfS/YnhG family)